MDYLLWVKIQKIHRSCACALAMRANTLPPRMASTRRPSVDRQYLIIYHKISIGIAYYYSLTMSNLAPIAPQFTAAGPTTLVLKEKKGLTLSGTELILILVLASSYFVIIDNHYSDFASAFISHSSIILHHHPTQVTLEKSKMPTET